MFYMNHLLDMHDKNHISNTPKIKINVELVLIVVHHYMVNLKKNNWSIVNVH